MNCKIALGKFHGKRLQYFGRENDNIEQEIVKVESSILMGKLTNKSEKEIYSEIHENIIRLIARYYSPTQKELVEQYNIENGIVDYLENPMHYRYMDSGKVMKNISEFKDTVIETTGDIQDFHDKAITTEFMKMYNYLSGVINSQIESPNRNLNNIDILYKSQQNVMDTLLVVLDLLEHSNKLIKER